MMKRERKTSKLTQNGFDLLRRALLDESVVDDDVLRPRETVEVAENERRVVSASARTKDASKK